MYKIIEIQNVQNIVTKYNKTIIDIHIYVYSYINSEKNSNQLTKLINGFN